MIGQTLGHYRIVEEIGAGGMGRIFRAHDTRLDRDVALKLLPPELADPVRLQRFEREARALASLNHPHIVTVHSVEEVEGLRFLTMELVEGRPLDAFLLEGGLEFERLFPVSVMLADALATAHAKGIVHRDLKPANIMLTDHGGVKVLDFGLARLLDEAASVARREIDSSTTTRDGVAVGTLPYMSPEQVQGHPGDVRSDVHAFGVLLYEMTTGERPFNGDSTAELASAILRDTPPAADRLRRDAPERLVRLIAHCMEKKPDLRPGNLAVVREELEAIARESAVAVHAPSIAVLPFADMSPEKDQDYFCEGIAEELINGLAAIRNLRVASRTSAFLFKNAALDIRDIGRQLHVDTILEGSVRKAAKRLRITAQLIDVRDGYHLWTERYDREIEDVFAIQEEIARNIVRALEVTLSPREAVPLEAAATRDVLAYDYYLRGRKLYYRYRRRDMELALQMFTLASRHDPAYARAYAGIADCCVYLVLNADRSAEYLRQADESSLRALEVGPGVPEAHASRGVVLSIGGRHEEAEREFETAIGLGPRLFEAWYHFARDAFAQGKLERAAQLFEKASAVNPGDYQSPLLVAQIYDTLELPERAAAARRRGVQAAGKRLRAHPEDVRALYMGANGLVALGQHEKGLEWANLALETDPDEPMVLYNVGCIYSLLGRIEEAMDALERAARAGIKDRGWYEHDSNLDAVRHHPRFPALMEWLVANQPRGEPAPPPAAE